MHIEYLGLTSIPRPLRHPRSLAVIALVTATTAGCAAMRPLDTNVGAGVVIDRTGLVAEYLFSGDANDTSGRNHHATASGALLTTDRAGVADSAYQFNGTDSMISAPNAADLNVSALTSRLTLEAWIYPTARKSQEIVRLGMTMATPYGLALTETGQIVGSVGSSPDLYQRKRRGMS